MAAPNGASSAPAPTHHFTTNPGAQQKINLGSRNSKLALVQADIVAAALSAVHPAFTFPIQTVMVRGDADKTSPFLQMADPNGRPDANKSLWTEEMEIMLAAGELDMLVHSLKDLPTVLPPGCALGAVMGRVDPSDALVVKPGLPYVRLAEMPAGSVVGTSSIRRKALLKRAYPQLVVKECRGNVPTRLNKLDAADGEFTCIVVASAGLIRLGLQDRITASLSPEEFPYAVGQGALGIEIRKDDPRISQMLTTVESNAMRWPCLAERALLRTLQGGCSSPVGVWSQVEDKTRDDESTLRALTLRLTGHVVHPDGQSDASSSATAEVGSDAEAEALGDKVAMQLFSAGADGILAQIRLVNAHAQVAHLERNMEQGRPKTQSQPTANGA